MTHNMPHNLQVYRRKAGEGQWILREKSACAHNHIHQLLCKGRAGAGRSYMVRLLFV